MASDDDVSYSSLSESWFPSKDANWYEWAYGRFQYTLDTLMCVLISFIFILSLILFFSTTELTISVSLRQAEEQPPPSDTVSLEQSLYDTDKSYIQALFIGSAIALVFILLEFSRIRTTSFKGVRNLKSQDIETSSKTLYIVLRLVILAALVAALVGSAVPRERSPNETYLSTKTFVQIKKMLIGFTTTAIALELLNGIVFLYAYNKNVSDDDRRDNRKDKKDYKRKQKLF
jgi:hypothetical protein